MSRARTVGALVLATAILAVACTHDAGRPEPGTASSGANHGEAQFGVAVPSTWPGVTLQDDVAIVSGGASAVRRVSEDGFTYTIDGGAGGLDRVQPDTVMVLTSRVAGRVVLVEDSGPDKAITLAPIGLGDLIRDGDLDLNQPLDPRTLVVTARPELAYDEQPAARDAAEAADGSEPDPTSSDSSTPTGGTPGTVAPPATTGPPTTTASTTSAPTTTGATAPAAAPASDGGGTSTVELVGLRADDPPDDERDDCLVSSPNTVTTLCPTDNPDHPVYDDWIVIGDDDPPRPGPQADSPGSAEAGGASASGRNPSGGGSASGGGGAGSGAAGGDGTAGGGSGAGPSGGRGPGPGADGSGSGSGSDSGSGDPARPDGGPSRGGRGGGTGAGAGGSTGSSDDSGGEPLDGEDLPTPKDGECQVAELNPEQPLPSDPLFSPRGFNPGALKLGSAAKEPPSERTDIGPVSVGVKASDDAIAAYITSETADEESFDKELKPVLAMGVCFSVHEPRVSGRLRISGGQVVEADFRVTGVHGVTISIAASSAAGVEGNVAVKGEVPIDFHAPFLVGGWPMDFAFRTKVLVKTAFSAKNSTVWGQGIYGIDGGLGFSKSGASYEVTTPTMTRRRGILDNLAGISVGVNGIVLAVQLRAQLGLGAPVFSVGPFAGITTSMGVTVGSDLGHLKCRGATLSVAGVAGLGAAANKESVARAQAIIKKVAGDAAAKKIAAVYDYPLLRADIVNRTAVRPQVPLCGG